MSTLDRERNRADRAAPRLDLWSQPLVVDRAVSLTQPWATLWVMGAKRIETRSWATPHRGWLAVHASATFPGICKALVYRDPFRSALEALNLFHPGDLPVGKIIGAVWLGDVVQTERFCPGRDTDEYAFGNYGPGRYAWRADGGMRLLTPRPAKGRLGIWKPAAAGVFIAPDDLQYVWGIE